MIFEIVAPGFIRKACGAVSQTRLNSADSVQDDSVFGCGASRQRDLTAEDLNGSQSRVILARLGRQVGLAAFGSALLC